MTAMRNPSDNDFFITVPDVGTFRFGRRTYGDRLKIRLEFLRLLRDLGEDSEKDDDLADMAGIIAAYKVLCVEAPKGWESLEKLDLLESDNEEEKIYQVYVALKEKERSFRLNAKQVSKEASEGALQAAGIPSSELLQNASDRSALPGDDPGAVGS